MLLERVPEHGGREPALQGADLDRLVAERAQRTPLRECAEKMGVSIATVNRYLTRPDVQEQLQTYREIIKRTMLERTHAGVVHGAFDVVEQAITDRDAKGLDAATRAVMNLEKVSASASGEGRKVELTGAGGGPVNLDVRALIASIVAHNE